MSDPIDDPATGTHRHPAPQQQKKKAWGAWKYVFGLCFLGFLVLSMFVFLLYNNNNNQRQMTLDSTAKQQADAAAAKAAAEEQIKQSKKTQMEMVDRDNDRHSEIDALKKQLKARPDLPEIPRENKPAPTNVLQTTVTSVVQQVIVVQQQPQVTYVVQPPTPPVVVQQPQQVIIQQSQPIVVYPPGYWYWSPTPMGNRYGY